MRRKIIAMISIILLGAMILTFGFKLPTVSAQSDLNSENSEFPLIGVVLLLIGLGGIGLRLNQRRALKASYLESIKLIKEAEKSVFIEETKEVLTKLRELRAELDNAYWSKDKEKISQIREELSQYVSMVKEIYSKYNTTKEEVINQITNILSIGSAPKIEASGGGENREG
ncbi:hypothetical protein [Thermococcus sp. AM4]|uniref:hypothetical protein n=1 Tax=Thermococcus sp. (strain AM4) TaxID=246969 RepID=UPI00064EE5C1|nr:hypothetical protein [Thermococcus sp. AM4]